MKPIRLLLFVHVVTLSLGPSIAFGQNFSDRFEPNDSIAQARTLEDDGNGLVEEPGLTIYPSGDVDYFKFTLPATGQAGHYIEIDAVMLHPILGVGRADFDLLDAQGNILASQDTPLGSGSDKISLQGRVPGSYALRVEGRISSYGAYNLTIRLPAGRPPTITAQPQSQTVTVGGTVTFTVVATGTAPLSYQWRRDGQPLAGQTGPSLTLANVQSAQAGSYTVVVSNSAGQVTSNPAVLTVNPGGPPPGVAARILPNGYRAGVAFTVTLQLTANESVVAFGVEDQPPAGWTVSNISGGGVFDAQNGKVKWDVFFVRKPEDRNQTLTYQVTPPAGAAGVGTFVGTASFDGINVTVSGDSAIAPGGGGEPPVITVHPQSQTVEIGGSVTFSVTATGEPPFSYQWRLNRVAIPGATGRTLTLNPVKASDAGSYTVVVSNSAGQVTSAPAILTLGAAGARFTEAKFLSKEGFRFRVTAPVGRRYALEASVDLLSWIEVATLDNPTGTLEHLDAEAVVFPQSFYRLRQVNP